MKRKVFEIYQYLFPVVLTPLGYWLWWQHYGGDHRMAAFVFSIPIIFAYVVPAVGTNVLKVWEFDTRFRLGRFRPHHGFVFGSATAILTWIVVGAPVPEANLSSMLIAGFILASVLGFWNWIYDIAALRTGILKVYNQPHADGKEAEAVATDYAPWFFGGFGFAYGFGIRLTERILLGEGQWDWGWLLFAAILFTAIALPVGIYVLHSRKAHGHNGCRPMRIKL